MARKKGKSSPDQTVMDYRHEDAKRKNIPPAGLAAQGKIREKPKIQYAYNPHLPPILRFDKTGKTDGLPELLATARTRPLTLEEAELLAEALRKQEPWLEWAGKPVKKGFEVDPVALHIHERIAIQAILKVIAREEVQRNLFADPQLEYHVGRGHEYLGVSHTYTPDFLVRLLPEVTLVLEIKGYENDQDRAKHQAARRWVSAVNNWGQLGRWAFHVCKDPQLLGRELQWLKEQATDR